jgi:tight adherence protein B
MLSLAVVVFFGIFTVTAVAVVVARLVMDRVEGTADDPRSEYDSDDSGLLNEDLSVLMREPEISSISMLAWILRRFNLVERLNRDLAEASMGATAGRITLATLLCGTLTLAVVLQFDWLPLWGVPILPLLACLLPYLYVIHRKNKRRSMIEEQFPEALESLARAIRAGHPFPSALENVAAQTPLPLGRELKTTFAEGALGMPYEQALDGLARRIPLQEICVFVAAVQMQSKSGGNLSEVLERLSENMREAAAIRGEVRALSSQGRFAGYILTMLPVAIATVLFFVSPEFLMILLTDEVGKTLLIGSVLSLVAAHFVIRKLVDIQL